MADSPLGQPTHYPEHYDPGLLHPIPRAAQRSRIGLTAELPFRGVDVWNAYELSWLNRQGLPQVALGQFVFDCASPNIIESKSFKLYLNSLNQERFGSIEDLRQCLQQDLSAAAGSSTAVTLAGLDSKLPIVEPVGVCLDSLDVSIEHYEPDSALLQFASQSQAELSVYSNLFRSNCPITQQPDWATVCIRYRGQEIAPESLLAYLVSYRLHNGYHEDCVEKIYTDIARVCRPEALTVQANFLRRGGLEINPIRSSSTIDESSCFRFIRQ